MICVAGARTRGVLCAADAIVVQVGAKNQMKAKSGASRVLEFLLERAAFYSPFATATILYEIPVFHS